MICFSFFLIGSWFLFSSFIFVMFAVMEVNILWFNVHNSITLSRMLSCCLDCCDNVWSVLSKLKHLVPWVFFTFNEGNYWCWYCWLNLLCKLYTFRCEFGNTRHGAGFRICSCSIKQWHNTVSRSEPFWNMYWTLNSIPRILKCHGYIGIVHFH